MFRWESSALCQQLNSWCSLSESLKKVTEEAEEKRLPQKIRFNCLETSPKLDKPTHFQKTPIGNFSSQRFTFIVKIFLNQCQLSWGWADMTFVTSNASFVSGKIPLPLVRFRKSDFSSQKISVMYSKDKVQSGSEEIILLIFLQF